MGRYARTEPTSTNASAYLVTKVTTVRSTLMMCASRPCENNGTCINGKDRYICECLLGYTGTNCEVEVDECESDPCENGATCNDLMGLYTCDCVKGFSGLNCEINIDECESAPCQNGGTCHDLVDR
ncbi:hypothetical protein SRHO_G00233160 [Serrasalmus rhombeus]